MVLSSKVVIVVFLYGRYQINGHRLYIFLLMYFLLSFSFNIYICINIFLFTSNGLVYLRLNRMSSISTHLLASPIYEVWELFLKIYIYTYDRYRWDRRKTAT